MRAQMFMPDQSKCQHGWLVFSVRTCHGCDLLATTGQPCPRENRRERPLEVHAARQILDLPSRKLPEQHATKLLSEILTNAAKRRVCALWTVEIEKAQASCSAPEPLNRAIEYTRGLALNVDNSARNAARLAPNLDPKPARTDVETIVARTKGDDFFPIFENSGVPASTDKSLNRGE